MHLALSGSVTVVYHYYYHHHHYFDDDDDWVVVELRLGICQIFHCASNNRQNQKTAVSAQRNLCACHEDRQGKWM
jgi:hypothetical protein